MWNYGWHMGWMWIGWLVLIAAIVWLIAAAVNPRIPVGGDDPETVLKRRYARGEIDRDEYQRRLDDLRR